MIPPLEFKGLARTPSVGTRTTDLELLPEKALVRPDFSTELVKIDKKSSVFMASIIVLHPGSPGVTNG
jgi:hypothetical protein